MLLQSIKFVNLMVLVMFLGCAWYNLCAHSQTPPSGREGALTIVDVDEDDDDGVVQVEDNGENGGEDLKDKLKEYEVFYPTKDWQPVKPGQAVPAGLHIRMNLQTGEKEAKLTEEDAAGLKFWETEGHQGMVNTDKKSFTRDELKRALKDFKSNVDGGGQDTKRAQEVKDKFRSYNDLKEDLKKMNIALKTDSEIITDLLQRFKTGSDTEAKKAVLEELEYHVHKIDSAQTFCDLGGMPLLLGSLNDTNSVLQSEAALVLGAALQSNPKVQISAIEHGAMHQLLKMLSTSSSTSVQKKCLFALSSLARHFPFAQKKFLELGGLSALKQLFEDTSLNAQKLQIKAITFLNDLLVEKELSEKHTTPDNSVDVERLRQYQQVDLKASMHEGGWCELIPQLLTVGDHDAREKVLHAMTTLVAECRPSFSTAVFELEKLQYEYEALAVEEKKEGDDYFSSLAKLISTMLISVRNRDEL